MEETLKAQKWRSLSYGLYNVLYWIGVYGGYRFGFGFGSLAFFFLRYHAGWVSCACLQCGMEKGMVDGLLFMYLGFLFLINRGENAGLGSLFWFTISPSVLIP